MRTEPHIARAAGSSAPRHRVTRQFVDEDDALRYLEIGKFGLACTDDAAFIQLSRALPDHDRDHALAKISMWNANNSRFLYFRQSVDETH
jgi:hypothetical protein